MHCVEPNPENLPKLRRTLAGYEQRVVVHEVAAGLSDEPVSFGIEPTGRYGGIGVETGTTITVPCREINALLDDVLEREGHIDVLKIDVESLESALVARLRPDLLERIDLIYYETDEPDPQHLDRFQHAFSLQTNRLARRAARAPR